MLPFIFFHLFFIFRKKWYSRDVRKFISHPFILASVLVASCATTSPKKYSVNKAGYATVERAPHMKRPKDTRIKVSLMPTEISEPLNRSAFIERQKQSNKYRQEAWDLEDRLKREQSGNFVAMDKVWEPEFHYRVFFKGNSKQTLADYTSNPVFKAGDYPTKAELDAHVDDVVKRLLKKDAYIGHSIGERYGNIETGLTLNEFGKLAGLQDLHEDPFIKLAFIRPFDPPEAIDPRLETQIRYLSRSKQLNAFVLTSLTVGRIVLRDGCFFLDNKTGVDPLVHFHKEVGVTLDTQGYIVIVNRLSNSNDVARVGEWAGWGDGIRDMTKPEIVEPLQAACGKHPIVRIGTPKSRFGERPKFRR